MEINQEELEKIIKDITDVKDINIADIPCVDLYMDQVTSFFEDKLGTLRRNEENKILTKTMINNYSKDKILMPAKNKKYTKQHMILLVLIYNLKQILSINDINNLFSTYFKCNDGSVDNEAIEQLYNCFLKVKKSDEENFTDDMNTKLKEINEVSTSFNIENKETAEMFLTVLTLINSANMQKRMAEKIIDKYFSK